MAFDFALLKAAAYCKNLFCFLRAHFFDGRGLCELGREGNAVYVIPFARGYVYTCIHLTFTPSILLDTAARSPQIVRIFSVAQGFGM